MTKSKINHDVDIFKDRIQPKLDLASKKINFKAKSYRFRNVDVIALEKLVQNINNYSCIKIKHTDVLRALIHHGKNVPETVLIDELRQLI